MNIVFWILIGIIIWVFLSRAMPAKGVHSIHTSNLKEKLRQKDVQFIDVRTPGEYQAHHIKQFKNIPLQRLGQELNNLDPHKETVLICQSGMRSMQAAKLLKKRGFSHVTNVQSGMNQWRA